MFQFNLITDCNVDIVSIVRCWEVVKRDIAETVTLHVGITKLTADERDKRGQAA